MTSAGMADLGMGCVKLGGLSPRAARRLVCAAIDQGITYFDTADSYGAGASEMALGRAIAGRRGGVRVATKGGYVVRERSRVEQQARRLAATALERVPRRHSSSAAAASAAPAGTQTSTASTYRHHDLSVEHLRDAVHASLRRLRTDHLDVYQLHGPAGPVDDEVVELMDELQRGGTIRAWGLGCETLTAAAAWFDARGLGVAQIPFGLLDPEAASSVLPRCRAAGVRVVARGVFAAGLLAPESPLATSMLRPEQLELRDRIVARCRAHGVDVLAAGLAMVRSTPGVSTVLIGMSTPRHLVDNLSLASTVVPVTLLDELRPRTDTSPAPDAGSSRPGSEAS
jgi:D-threo-aldose 1-dehydrogenase